jgi:hypothetical protein
VETPPRTRTYRSHHLDSTRWDHLTLRSGDIVIATSMKAGTTWMQRIVSLLVFGEGPLRAQPIFKCHHRGPQGWYENLRVGGPTSRIST